MQQLTLNQEFMVTIKRIGINGEGVGYYKKQVVFIPNSLPGEVIIAKATKLEKDFAYAEVVRVKEPSPLRVKPRCPVYFRCGGCQLMHIDEKEHGNIKKDIVKQAFERYTKLDVEKLDIRDTILMDNPYNYRNKAQLPIMRKGSDIVMGLYELGTNKIVDMTSCYVQDRDVNHVLKNIKEIVEDLEIDVSKNHLKFVVARKSFTTKEIQVTFVTKSRILKDMDELVTETSKIKGVKSIAQNVNGEETSLVFGDKTYILWGNERITERLGNVKFELNPRDFFQLNPKQTVVLYDLIKNAIKGKDIKKVVDCYCGVGTIGQYIYEKGMELRGIESIESAVKSATKNAKANKLENFMYKAGNVEEILPQWVNEGWLPDLLVVDPPRVGLDEEIIKVLIKNRIKNVVYVSCNPSTLAKNIHAISKYYNVKYIQPVDMFPHTAQVETVVLLERR